VHAGKQRTSLHAINRQDPSNYDETVVEAFGDEWARFDQSELSQAELEEAFSGYFGIFPWDRIDAKARVSTWGAAADVGQSWWPRESAS